MQSIFTFSFICAIIYLEKAMPRRIYRVAVLCGYFIIGNILLGGWSSASSWAQVVSAYGMAGGTRAAFALAAVFGAFTW
jgi:hypothetical protein